MTFVGVELRYLINMLKKLKKLRETMQKEEIRELKWLSSDKQMVYQKKVVLREIFCIFSNAINYQKINKKRWSYIYIYIYIYIHISDKPAGCTGGGWCTKQMPL